MGGFCIGGMPIEAKGVGIIAEPKYKKWLDADHLKLLEAWARDGLTNEEIAERVGIDRRTLTRWRSKYKLIDDAVKRGKELVDIEVENSLFKNAMGYYAEEEKIYISQVDGEEVVKREIFKRYIKPDTTAQIFWLKNRKPDEWRDKPKELKLTTEDRLYNVFSGLDKEIFKHDDNKTK